MYQQGWGQLIPFVATIVVMLLTDLLIGVGFGLVVSVFIILRNNFRSPFAVEHHKAEKKSNFKVVLSEDVTFINKASLLKFSKEIPDNTNITIDASKSVFIHYDIIEIIEDFTVNAKTRNIKVEVKDLYKKRQIEPISHFKIKNNAK